MTANTLKRRESTGRCGGVESQNYGEGGERLRRVGEKNTAVRTEGAEGVQGAGR